MKNATGKYSCVKRQFSEMNSDKLYNQINSDDKRSTTNFHMERNSQSTFPYTKIRKVDNKSLSLNKFDVKPKYHEALLDKGLIKETEWNGSRRIRRIVKSSEEIILEEMQKFKFYANPINRSIFRLSENAKPFVRKCCLPKKIEREIANDTVKERKIFSCSKAFSAKPLPNFTLFEVKKSSRLLTVPVSPKLKTKSRSVSYRNKMLNNIH